MGDLEEDRYRKEPNEGSFTVEHDTGREGQCDPAEDRCAPDSESNDPYDSRNIPGTADDVPTSLGEDAPEPADLQVNAVADAEEPPRFGSALPRGAAYEGLTGGEERATRESRDERDYGLGAAVPDAALRSAPSTMDAENVARLGQTDAPSAVGGVDAEDIDDVDTLAEQDERELWSDQSQLIEEDERDSYNLQGIPEDEIDDVMNAIGDDAEEANSELPEGTSATGTSSPLEPAHGGFPEREE